MSPIIAPPFNPSSGITLLQLGRLALPTIGKDFKEAVGEPLDTTGAGVALGQRRPKGFGFEVPILVIPDASGQNFTAAGNRMRRGLRSILQNNRLRGEALYLQFTPDPELNGWVIPGNGQIAYQDGNVGFGHYLLTLDEIYRIGTTWTHLPGLRCVNVDRRLSSTPRDYRGQVFSLDFGASTATAVNYMPVAATSLASTVGSPLTTGTWTGKDGTGRTVTGAATEEVVAFEMTDANRNLGQVVTYDRRGYLTAPTTGPDPLWEEAYGASYPWNWQTPAQPQDTPLLDNGVCRVRYDASVGLPGFRVDVWTGSAWTEQCKVVFGRRAAANVTDDTWVAAGIPETDCTPARTVMRVVLRSSADNASMETVYVTLQRGWSGPRFEIYPSASGAVRGAAINVVTTTTGGTSTRSGNAWAVPGSAYLVVGAFIQVAAATPDITDSTAYGVAKQGISTTVDGQGYVSLQLGFYALGTAAASMSALGAAALYDCREVPVLVPR